MLGIIILDLANFLRIRYTNFRVDFKSLRMSRTKHTTDAVASTWIGRIGRLAINPIIQVTPKTNHRRESFENQP